MSEFNDADFSMMHPEGAPGQIQQIMGDAAFRQMLEGNSLQHKSASVALDAIAKRQAALTGVINLGAVLAVMVAIPVLVMLWRWALG